MTENMKKFLEAVSADDSLNERLSEIQNASTPEEAEKEIILVAESIGIKLTKEDLTEKKEERELSDDELEAVAGGWKECVCSIGGGGTKDNKGKTCACVAYGQGDARDGRARCLCAFAGWGMSPESIG